MEINLIQILSAVVVLLSSSVPFYFTVKIKDSRQRILSSLLLSALIAYSIHSIFEAFGFDNHQVFTKICFVVAAFGLMTSYIFFQIRKNHVIIGGIFGMIMMASFGTWFVGELFNSFFVMGLENIEIIKYINSIAMTGFGIFLIVRFFWLRNITPIDSKYLNS